MTRGQGTRENPKRKSQIPTKAQLPNANRGSGLELRGIWEFIGCWVVEFRWDLVFRWDWGFGIWEFV